MSLINNTTAYNSTSTTNNSTSANNSAYKQAQYTSGVGLPPIQISIDPGTQSKINWFEQKRYGTYYMPQSTLGLDFIKPYTYTDYIKQQYNTTPQSGNWIDKGKFMDHLTTSVQNTEQKKEEGKDEKEEGDDNGGNPGFAMDWATAAGTGVSAATTAFGKQYDDDGFRTEETISKAASAFGPYGVLAGAMASLSSQVTRATDMDTKYISDRSRKAAGVSKGAQLGNNFMSWFNNTTFGSGWTSFVAPFFGASPMWGYSATMDKTPEYSMSREAESLSGAYSGTTDKMRAAEDVAGGRFFFGKQKFNDLVNNSIKSDQLLQQIGIDNEQRVSSVPYNAEMIASRNFRKLNGMTGQSYATRVGKEGMKMLSREELNKIYAAKKVEESDITKLQNGGSILVPEGALHAHKHHMEEVNPELAEDLTKKGIPVVAVDENGEVTQVAEIEKQELIFEKSLTEQIEKLWKDGSEEAMIEAGKIITCTLFTNCDDNAGLVEEVQ